MCQSWKVSCFCQCIMLIPVVLIMLVLSCLERCGSFLGFFFCAPRICNGSSKSHGSPHQSDWCRDVMCQSSCISIRRLMQESSYWKLFSFYLAVEAQHQIMSLKFLIISLFLYYWPWFRTFGVCTGVCLNVTSIVCSNKAVDIWTLCD